MLGVVHFQVGTVDGIGQRVGAVHAANADGGLEVRAARHGDALHPAANLLQAGSKNVRGDAGEEQQKLVPAVAAEDVAVSGAPAQQLAEGFQQLAVMVVTAAVADFFQAAQIENIQCQRQVLQPQGIQRGMEAAAVQQTRQIVSAGMVLRRAPVPCGWISRSAAPAASADPPGYGAF